MISRTDPDPAAPTTVSGVPALGAALREADFDSANLRALLGVDGSDIPFTPTSLVAHERRLAASPCSVATLAAVFCLGWERPADDLVAALGRDAVDALIASGAALERGSEIAATVRILPHGELFVTSDRRPRPGTLAGPLHVTGINAPATLLASLSVREPGVRALDLGTGNGIQALLAASHASSVVATDVNPRALAFGMFNAALNGIDRIEFRLGSWYEPVAGERFDLVVSNPPYVISPENDLVYRDSGDEPGALCGRLIRDAPEYLTEQGYATFLASWPLTAARSTATSGPGSHDAPDAAEPWWSVPASWIGPDGWAWLMLMRREDPITHATQWNLPLASTPRDDDLTDYRNAVRRWTDYLADRHIDAIGYGAIVQQHQPGAGRIVRHDEVRAGSGSASRHILRVFAAAAQLAAETSTGAGRKPELSERTCAIPAETRMDGTFVPADTGWTQGAAELRLTEGLGIRADLDPVMTEIVLAVTSGMGVDAAADAAADRMAMPEPKRQDLRASARAMVLELVGLGLLEFASA
jgi:hypothetical protein